MRVPLVSLPDERSARTVRVSRRVSYALAAVAAVVLSIAPSVLGDPQASPWHLLLHVVRPIVAGVFVAGAVAVQLTVGLRWHARLRGGAGLSGEDDSEDPGEGAVTDPAEGSPDARSTAAPSPRDTASRDR